MAFSPAARGRLRTLRNNVTAVVADPYASDYPVAWSSGVTVETADGERLVAKRTGAKGDPDLVLTTEEMIAKAKMLLEYAGFDQTGAQRVIDGVLGLVEEEGTPDIVS